MKQLPVDWLCELFLWDT